MSSTARQLARSASRSSAPRSTQTTTHHRTTDQLCRHRRSATCASRTPTHGRRIANPLTSIDAYDVILLGSPIWNVRPPMIMSTFAESFDFTGKTIHSFVTYAVSGLGTTIQTYKDLSTAAAISSGLAVLGETVKQADPQVRAWLRRINVLN